MKNKKALIIGIILIIVLIIILVSNFFNKNITGKPGEIIGGAVGTIENIGGKTTRGSLDDPDSNINKLLKLDVDREVVIPTIETTKMDSEYSLKYSKLPNDKFLYTDYSESAKEYLTENSFSGVFVLNILGKVCDENNIQLSSMSCGETITSADPNYEAAAFESNKYKVSIFFREDIFEANVKLEVIG